MSDLVAGIDSSTQATKVVVIDPESGRLVAEGRAAHTVTGVDGARESDPEMWWRALAEAMAMTRAAHRVGAVSVAAQQHGLVALDSRGTPVRPAILWNDTRGAGAADALVAGRAGPEWWARTIGSVPVAAFTASSWAWMRQSEPELAERTRGIRLPHDFLTERLTGNAVTDRGDASGTGWWSPIAGAYVPEVLDSLEISLDESMLPAVLDHDHSAGTITPEAAARSGLKAGVPVGAGTGDNMAAALGVGLAPGQVAMSLGTSGTVFATSTAPTTDASGTVAGFADAGGAYLPLACTLNCTLAVDKMASLLGIDREDAAAETDVVVLPYLDGERTPNLPDAAGTVSGLRHSTERGEILLAAYRGAAASLLDAAECISREADGVPLDADIVLIGGGARGATWRRVVSELSGARLIVPEPAEFVARGAAAQAAAILRGEHPGDVARRWAQTTMREEVAPREADTGARERIRAAVAAAREISPAGTDS